MILSSSNLYFVLNKVKSITINKAKVLQFSEQKGVIFLNHILLLNMLN